MRLAIFGGSGGSGKALITQALAAGHEVTALVRDPSKLPVELSQHVGLKLVQGDATDADKVGETIRGSEAVLSLLGPTKTSPKGMCATSTRLILASMKQNSVRRVVMASVAGIAVPQDNRKGFAKFIGVVLKLLIKEMFLDREAQLNLLQSSDADWVAIRLPRLTNHPASGKYLLGYPAMSPKLVISREDLATAMLAQLTDNTWLKQAPVISNT